MEKMSKQLNVKNRKAFRAKMAEVLKSEIKELPVDMQYILLDDLVTAFETRLSLFSHAKANQTPENFEFVVTNEQILA